jgi:hypothetical protein
MLGAGVQLEISDDAGNSYDDMGTVTVTPGEVRRNCRGIR